MTPTGEIIDPLMAVDWIPALLRVRTATGAVEAPAPAAEKAAEPEVRIRGLDLPEDNAKPVLVFFHWPHEDGERGRRIQKFCGGPLDDEAFVRVTALFRCVEVNTRDSEPRLVEEARVKATPTLLVCRPDGTVLWRTEEPAMAGRALADTLKGVLREKLAARWAEVEKAAKAQKEGLEKARRLLADGKAEEGMAAIYAIVDSDVRYTDEWAAAVKFMREREKQEAEAKKKK